MSSVNHIPMTEEQEEFLKALEEEFKDRYTENDKEFKEIMDQKPSLPPVIRSWFEHRNRYNNYHDDRHYGRLRGEDGHYNRHYSRHRDEVGPYDRHYSRHRNEDGPYRHSRSPHP